MPEERLWSLMAACDVLVNLRYPTMGETSGSVIRALSLGKPLLVSDVGWFRELPDDVVLKVPVDEYEVATLAAALELAADHGAAARRGGARRTSTREHDLGRVADAYVAALEDGRGRRRGRRRGAAGGSPRRPPRSASTTPARARARRASTAGHRRRERVAARARARSRARVGRGSRRSSSSRSPCGSRSRGRMVAPWIMVDEIIYSELAKSFAAHGQFLVRGVPSTATASSTRC